MSWQLLSGGTRASVAPHLCSIAAVAVGIFQEWVSLGMAPQGLQDCC